MSYRRAIARLSLAAACLIVPLLLAGSPASAYSNSFCSFGNQGEFGIGGKFFCNSDSSSKFPNGTWEVYVVGTDHAVWTDWEQCKGGCWAGWHTMNGYAIDGTFATTSNWAVYLDVVGSDHNYWERRRGNCQNCGWTDWYRT